MKINEIKEGTFVYYAIDLNNLNNTTRSIFPIESADDSPWGTYLKCYIYPNFGNYTISMKLFDGVHEVESYSINGWKFLFDKYIHVNWNYRLCNYYVTDNTGETKCGRDDYDLGGKLYKDRVSLEIDDLIRCGWRDFFNISNKYYSFNHRHLISQLNANLHAIRPTKVSLERMGRMVLYRQKTIKEIDDFIDSIPEDKKSVYAKSIAMMQDVLDRYCKLLWNITIEEDKETN